MTFGYRSHLGATALSEDADCPSGAPSERKDKPGCMLGAPSIASLANFSVGQTGAIGAISVTLTLPAPF